MPTIIVCSNFSDTSRNALGYACSLISNRSDAGEITILLLNIYTIPANYSGDGIALVTINNALNYAEEDLHEELEWAHEQYPEVNIIGKVTTGDFIDALHEQIAEMEASLVIMGTGGQYGELWSWDSNILQILRELPVPVLTIPPDVSYKPLLNIAFACNVKNVNQSTPFQALKNLINFTNSHLHIVYVSTGQIKPATIEAANEALLHDRLKDLSPTYHTLYENEVVSAIGKFVEDKKIQLLLVMPRKHGVW
jgi:nucleotide-binding universal stress UspA family protein